MKIKILFDKEYEKEFSEPVLLSKALSGFPISLPCGGHGICGKCKVRAYGCLSPVTEREGKFLSKEELSQGIRLACMTHALGDAQIEPISLNPIGIEQGYMPEFEYNSIATKYGAAVDIGTTTVAYYFYKFPEYSLKFSGCTANAQIKYGADVLSRVEFAIKNGIKEMQSSILNQLAGIIPPEADTLVITGNTIMLHILRGYSLEGFAFSPFKPESLFGEWINISGRQAYLPRCISPFVGADIVCAILASGMTDSPKTSLLIDIGTNGEMVLWHKEKLYCASTAAGPAFEGAGIGMGMSASGGAIKRVYTDGAHVKYETIGGEARGICGSGLIDCIAVMLDTGALDRTGYMKRDFQIGSSQVVITQKDVRSLQLAKSAVRSGIDALLKHCSVEYDEIDTVYIAGSFGNYIDKKNAERIGILPPGFADKAVSIGNAAGSGACAILLSRGMLEKSEKIAEAAQTLSLTEDEYFMKRFIDNMYF